MIARAFNGLRGSQISMNRAFREARFRIVSPGGRWSSPSGRRVPDATSLPCERTPALKAEFRRRVGVGCEPFRLTHAH
jgi:hypothetical protein